ncbi:MAG: hypothetical protein ACYDDF_00850 [Thermoplasmatota archaeon]
MELEVRVGSVLAKILEVVPGAPGQGAAVEETLRRVKPDIVCADVAIADIAEKSEGGYPGLLRGALSARGFEERASPVALARDWARATNTEFVPLLRDTESVGFFARRRILKAVGTSRSAPDPRMVAHAMRVAVRAGGPAAIKTFHQGEEAMAANLRKLLAEDQRSRLLAILTYPRSERVTGLLLGHPVAPEVARIGHDSTR